MRTINTLAVAAAALATAALIPQAASADRVCRERCVAGVCNERCIETEGRADRRWEGREERREERFEMRRERRPGVEFRAPGVEVEVGR
jgi:hypothetical protein